MADTRRIFLRARGVNCSSPASVGRMNADRPALEKEPDRDGRAIGPRNLLVLDVDSLLAPIDLELETLAYQGHCFALAGQSLTTDRASICVQLRMMKCESGDAAPA